MTERKDSLWQLLTVAEAHDTMNRTYNENGEMDNYPSFVNLLAAVRNVLHLHSNVPMSCLDVGCGAGWQMKYLASKMGSLVREWTGMDLSGHMCERARVNFPEATFYETNVLDWIPNRTWDLVMSCGAMPFVEDWHGFIKKMAELSRRWVIIHRMAFTDGDTRREEGGMYCGLKTPAIVLNYKEFVDQTRVFALMPIIRFGNDEGVILEKVL
jgi:cyclopropane fatty-acyl-phospholipid synthase-like methyltransferase